MRYTLIFFIALLFIQCSGPEYRLDIDIQGHRGCRGSLPENSKAGFISAITKRVNTLEMDVIISKDSKVVVSHEAYLNPEICWSLDTTNLTEEEGKAINLYELDYNEIAQYDCGSKPHPRFEMQQPLQSVKPLLESVLFACEFFIQKKELMPVRYNIETKCAPETDGIYHPDPATFVHLLMQTIEKANVLDKTTIQSFDVRTLQEVRKQGFHNEISLLVENELGIEENIKLLGFKPDVYSPDYNYVDEAMVEYCKSNQILLKPWTVNEKNAILRMLELGVDGIITDYPHGAVQLLKQLRENG